MHYLDVAMGHERFQMLSREKNRTRINTQPEAARSSIAASDTCSGEISSPTQSIVMDNRQYR